jgi:tetratricopeptide (TPR) repeat protein
VTYNGRTFDQPLLETRYRLHRARPPFGSMEHVDLLYGSRRLWKLRFDSCRLVELETQVLGVEREGDVPGALIPYLYFEFLRTKQAGRLLPVFYHNATDILTLACLAGIVPHAFRDPSSAGLRHGGEMVGMARWLLQAGELEPARDLFRRAIHAGLKDELTFRTLWDLAALERKLGEAAAALNIWSDLSDCRNAYRMKAFEELAKHHEHHAKDYARALEIAHSALVIEDSDAWRHREQRLLRRMRHLSTAKSARML